MRKVLGLVILASLVLAAVSSADPYVWKVRRQLDWRSSKANLAGFVDSTLANRGTGVANTTLDTTEAVKAEELYWNPSLQSADTDTIPYFAIEITPRAAIESSTDPSSDSVYVEIQASLDGIGWVGLTPTQTFNGTLTATGAVALTENGTSDCYVKTYKQLVTATKGMGAGPKFTASEEHLFGWNFYRFIVGGDHVGEWTAKLAGWAPMIAGSDNN